MRLLHRETMLPLLLLNLFCLIRPAEEHFPQYAGMPYVMVLSYDQSHKYPAIVQHLLQQGLMNKLNILPAPIEHASADKKEEFIREMGQPGNYADFEVEYSYLTGAYLKYAGRGSKPEDILTSKAAEARPVIILCDTYGAKILQEVLKNAPANAVHSVILFNPSVYQPINYDAISHRLYNFYSKTGLTGVRKYSPDNNGFIPKMLRSKVVNINCTQEQKFDTDVPFVFSAHSIEQMNLPAIIERADRDYPLNWDLSAVISKAPIGQSHYEHMQLPLLFLNRALEIKGNVVTNAKENWSYKLSSEEVVRVVKQLDREEQYHAKVTAPCYDEALKGYRCPSLKEAPYVKKVAAKQAPDGAAFFVPAKNNAGIYLVVFARSLDSADLVKSSFTVQAGEGTLPCSKFIFLGKNQPLGQYIGDRPYLTSLIDDPYYYAIAKFFMAKDELAKLARERFTVLFKKKPLESMLKNENKGTMPEVIRGDFDFVAYADVQKQNQLYPLNEPSSGSAVYTLADIVRSNERFPLSLHLVVGDLVRNGKNWNSWDEILSKLSQMLSNQYISSSAPFSLLATAIGTHDFADVDWQLLSFYPMKPTYGYLFNFNPRVEPGVDELLGPQEHVNNTQLWFDIGRVRFIHLPYTTEEEESILADVGKDDLSGYLTWIKNFFKRAGHPFTFDSSAIIDEFAKNLNLAVEARNNKDIDFIIVYGHAPLATAPQYKHEHPGLLNSLANNDIKSAAKRAFAEKLMRLLATAGIDLYLSGHNHQYDNCVITINPQTANEKSFRAITIGLGTTLRCAAPSNKPAVLAGQSAGGITFAIASEKFICGSDLATTYINLSVGGFLPAYLKCQVRGKTARCQLLARDRTVLDAFEIQSHNQ